MWMRVCFSMTAPENGVNNNYIDSIVNQKLINNVNQLVMFRFLTLIIIDFLKYFKVIFNVAS